MLLKHATFWQKKIDSFHHKLCQLVSWFTLLMVLLTFLIVILRYGFNLGWIAMQESVMYLHAMVFLLGAAHTLRANEHVRVDIFYRRFSPKKQAKVDIFGSLFLLLPVNIYIFFISIEYVLRSWRIMEASQEAGGLPAVFILKTLILIFALTMLLQGIAEVIGNILRLSSNTNNTIAEGS
ncbi:TRAP transporter small permease subunit [uncultured Paraglaciecola sp.]|uniref:TRAP transporter small permease subunit n=1 Tax=uncultured Paraglaciecola sp. TaxID=1765024 RepID=UPI002632C7BB|nr:TRAP transporter small permease subunit [uncultured Paraglaciecola sp.]